MTKPPCAAIQEHYAAVWSSQPVAELKLTRGPVHELPMDFDILKFKRSVDTWAYATRCMLRPEEEDSLALYMVTSSEYDDDITELLTIVAHYHLTGARLGLAHTVNFGRPWVPNATCTHGLLSHPYLDGPQMEWSTEPPVQCLWLLPITEAEVRFKKSHGLEALEQKFDELQLRLLDPFRSSVV